ncbi:MAG: UDP-2,3-diacylglucosamine diphosphatase [Syntrophobacterales bacterium]|nr:UDP-2,3-diacylglucosamine diphosphatase [Syntrophobacterales bacterium]
MIDLPSIAAADYPPETRSLFLADAHLRERRDHNYEVLMDFLRHLSGPAAGPGRGPVPDVVKIDHLFILGDFFDFWFSRRGRIFPGFVQVVERLQVLKGEGVAVHLCEGNHDFFMTSYFTRRLEMEVWEDWASLLLAGRRVLIGHGDLVDETNLNYLRLRKLLRSRAFFLLQRLMPLSFLWRMARMSSQTSQEYMGGAQEEIAVKMEAFARKKFREGYDVVILGHCHKAQHREIVTEDGIKTFVTLGDWVSQFTCLHYDDRRFRLCRYAGEGRLIGLDTV